MPDSQLTIEERQEGDVTILALKGQMVVDDGDLVFRRCIHDLMDHGHVRILADLANVTYIDSSGIGMLAAKLKTLRDRGGDLRLLHLSVKSQRLLGMLKLRTAFEIFDDETLAVRSFARPTV